MNLIHDSQKKSLRKAIADGESDRVEFKAGFDRETIQSLVAFANTRGGCVIVGVDNQGTVHGIQTGQETIQNWLNQIKQATSPSIFPDIDLGTENDKTIAVLSIQEYPVKPVSCKGRCFKRIKNSNHQMSISEISNLYLKTMNTSWDFYPDPNHTLNNISLEKVNNFIELSNKIRSYPIDDSPLTVLHKYELLKEEDKITYGCYLLFADADVLLSAIDLGAFAGETTITDSFTSHSDLISQIDEALQFITKHITKAYIITGDAQREERWEFPLEAIREIVVNMIVHRDYTSPSESSIKIFKDRIEFFNPGKLAEGLTVDRLLSGDYTSTIRNKQIASVLKDAGIIERYDSGIKRILERFSMYGLVQPVFEELQGGFRVTILKTTQKTTQKISTKEHILQLLKESPRLTRAELATAL
ncbi:MAG: putative DNA binding domain-containing protein, partial [Deltaproteobacteria bacterium]|nr:putative DNA binding domain-containing protein [Deltaproteobacteria bacterium]